MRKLPIPTILTAGLLVIVMVAYAFTYQVRFSEVGVKTRFGQADESSIKKEPGIYFRLPWPVEQVTTYDKRLRTIDTPEGQTTTRDGKNIVVGCYALWEIDPDQALKFYKVVTTDYKAANQIRERINSARQLVFGRHDLHDLFGLDEQQTLRNHEQIEKELLEAVAPGVKDSYGINVRSVGIRRISWPESAVEEVFKSMSQQRETMAAGYRAEGESLATSIESRATQAAEQIRSFALRKAAEIESEGRRAATTYLTQIEQQDREFFLFLRQLEVIEAMLKQNSTIFLDTANDLLKVFSNPSVQAREPSPKKPDPSRISLDGINTPKAE